MVDVASLRPGSHIAAGLTTVIIEDDGWIMSISRPLMLPQLPADVLWLILRDGSQADAFSLSLTCLALFELGRKRGFEALTFLSTKCANMSIKLVKISQREDLRSLVSTLFFDWDEDAFTVVPAEPEYIEAAEWLLTTIVPLFDRLQRLTIPYGYLTWSSIFQIGSHPSLRRLRPAMGSFFDLDDVDLAAPAPSFRPRAFPVVVEDVAFSSPSVSAPVQDIFLRLTEYGLQVEKASVWANSAMEIVWPAKTAFPGISHLELHATKENLDVLRLWLKTYIRARPSLAEIELDVGLGPAVTRARLGDAWSITSPSDLPVSGEVEFLTAFDGHVESFVCTWTPRPVHAVTKLSLTMLGLEWTMKSKDLEALIGYLPHLESFSLSSGDGHSLITDWDELLPVFSRLPRLVFLFLRTPLSPTPSASSLCCSLACLDLMIKSILEEASDQLPHLLDGLNAFGDSPTSGFKTWNALISELHLARLRRLAPYLSVGTRVSWQLLEDESSTPWSLLEAAADPEGVPNYVGEVCFDLEGSKKLALARSQHFVRLRGPDSDDEEESEGRCYGCDVRLRGLGQCKNPMEMLQDFSVEELEDALAAVRLAQSLNVVPPAQ